MALVVSSTPTYGQALAPKGQIAKVWVADGQNYAFRVYLLDNGSDPLSSCVFNFAYVNASNNNYQAIVSTLLSSYAQKKPVLLHAYKENSGFCRIDEIEF
jgi:hypothetical protein